jgi:hypothetical protein
MAKEKQSPSTIEAIRRVKHIASTLHDEVRRTVATHVTMDTLNETVPVELNGAPTEAAYTFNAIQDALAMKLVTDLARIFDFTDNPVFPIDGQDKASIPVLAALLRRDDVQRALMDDARDWTPDFVDGQMAASRRAVAAFLCVADQITVDRTAEHEAFVRIREYRTMRLAHHLFDKTPDRPPSFRDLSLLLGIAMQAAQHSALAVHGQVVDPQVWIEDDKESTMSFCRCLIAGAGGGSSGG